MLFVAPLLILYEIGLHLVDSDIRNAVELAVKELLWYLGPAASYLHAFLFVVMGWALLKVMADRQRVYRLFPPFLIECLLLALLLGPVVALLTGSFQLAAEVPEGTPSGPPLRESLLASVAAGIYEEALFRLVLLGGLFVVLVRALRVPRTPAFLVALLVSAVTFSLYHHLGPSGEPFETRAFVFRAVAGILLGLVFASRGLGVVVYLHALYDVLYDLRMAAWIP